MQADVLQIVAGFLRGWLPPEARLVYRQMMISDPLHWSEDPHFAGGIIIDHALRGNGIDEALLGVDDLNAVWPEILRLAVLGEDANGQNESNQVR